MVSTSCPEALQPSEGVPNCGTFGFTQCLNSPINTFAHDSLTFPDTLSVPDSLTFLDSLTVPSSFGLGAPPIFEESIQDTVIDRCVGRVRYFDPRSAEADDSV